MGFIAPALELWAEVQLLQQAVGLGSRTRLKIEPGLPEKSVNVVIVISGIDLVYLPNGAMFGLSLVCDALADEELPPGWRRGQKVQWPTVNR